MKLKRYIPPERRAVICDEIEPIARECFEKFPDEVVKIVGGGDERREEVRKWVDELITRTFERLRKSEH